MEPLRKESATLDHVRNFLSFADSGERFLRVARLAAKAAGKDAATRENLASIQRWIAQPHTRDRGQESIDLFLPVLYLRAQDGIRGAKLSSEADLKRLAKRAKESLNSLETDFIEQLLVETKSRRKRDRSFAQKIDLAAGEIAALTPSLEQITNELIPRLRPAGESSKQAGCTINDQAVPCWKAVAVIILIIAIVVILK